MEFTPKYFFDILQAWQIKCIMNYKQVTKMKLFQLQMVSNLSIVLIVIVILTVLYFDMGKRVSIKMLI